MGILATRDIRVHLKEMIKSSDEKAEHDSS